MYLIIVFFPKLYDHTRAVFVESLIMFSWGACVYLHTRFFAVPIIAC